MEFEKLNFDFKNHIVFLDIDGTLVPDGDLVLDSEVVRQVQKLQQKNSVFLCTNSHDKIRKSKIEALLNLSIITHKHKKPSRKIIDGLKINSASNQFLVIGDKWLTDGRFAKNIGAQFIKTKRKVSGQESFSVQLINFLDDLIWRILHPKNYI